MTPRAGCCSSRTIRASRQFRSSRTRPMRSTALAQLERLISTFPFVAAADRSVALSAILTTLDRRSMATAPLHAFTSPTAGTGKSLLVDVAAMLATGRPMPVIAQGRTEEELEKRLGAALLAGDMAISLDNCDHVLEGSFLCQVLTQRQLNIRILGQSRNAETPVNATIFATGNNLTIAGDLIRRSLLCSMDAGCERPELRVFNVNAIEATKANRGELVCAALTVLRAWHLAAPGTEKACRRSARSRNGHIEYGNRWSGSTRSTPAKPWPRSVKTILIVTCSSP